MPIDIEHPKESTLQNAFTGYGITCGSIGFCKLISSPWYLQHKSAVDTYIKDYKTTDDIKIIAIPQSIVDTQNFNPWNRPMIIDWKWLGLDKSFLKLSFDNIPFLQKIIKECGGHQVYPKWWVFGHNSKNIQRAEIVNIPTASKILEEYITRDIVTIVNSYCEMDSSIPNDLSNYWY